MFESSVWSIVILRYGVLNILCLIQISSDPDQELEERMRVSLKLSQRIKPAVEDPYIESSEEESEEEEEDKDFPLLTDEVIALFDNLNATEVLNNLKENG